MHEMSIAQSIVEIVEETMAGQNGNGKLKEVVVEIGELVAVVPDSLEFCYQALVQDTPYTDSKIRIEILPLTGNCTDCNKQFHVENFMFNCPYCDSVTIEILSGQNELNIKYLEIE